MKKKILLLLILLFILSCSVNEIPPEPGKPGATLGQATISIEQSLNQFRGYAPAFSVFEELNNKPFPIFTIGQQSTSMEFDTYFLGNDDQVNLNIKVKQPFGFVWGFGYYYNYQENKWDLYEFPGERAGSSNFISEFTETQLVIPKERISLDKKNFVLAYTCKKYSQFGNDFKCGCSSLNGPCNQWMIHFYDVEGQELPDAPDDPGGVGGDPSLLEMHIATEKNGYGVGDTVLLTKPVETQGFIIEFEEKPIVEKQLELEKELGEGLVGHAFNNLNIRLNNHKNKIKNQREEILGDILGQSNTNLITGAATFSAKTDIVIAEYETTFNGVALDINEEQAESIKNVPGVKNVFRNIIVKAHLPKSVPSINADDVHLLDEDGNACLSSGKECLTGKGVTIAVIDTGIDHTHPDLGGCIGPGCKVIGGVNFIDESLDSLDVQGHGTHVAGIIAANGQLKGVAPEASLLAYKVLGADGRGSLSTVLSAVQRAVDPNQDGDTSDHLDIISLSLGSLEPGDPTNIEHVALDNSINNAVKAGVVAIIAAGNSGADNTISSPGTALKALTVGASCRPEQISQGFLCPGPVSSISSRGPLPDERIKPEVIAPGVNICSTKWTAITGFRGCPLENQLISTGTSMATPHVSGIAALILQKHPDWTPDEIKNAIKLTSIDAGEPINAQGFGIVDALLVNDLQSNPCVAELSSTLQSLSEPVFSVSGSATCRSGLQNWKLSIGSGLNPETSTLLLESLTEIEEDFLIGDVSIDVMAPGDNTIELAVTNTDGVVSKDHIFIKSKTECSDGFDNDNDGDTDLTDSDCDDAGDDSESSLTACSDTIDNDKDGKIDLEDPGCDDAQDDDETDTASCEDGLQNQDETDADCGGKKCAACEDGKKCLVITDCAKLKCINNVCNSLTVCSDGIDNDLDGAIDEEDPGCDSSDDTDEFDEKESSLLTNPSSGAITGILSFSIQRLTDDNSQSPSFNLIDEEITIQSGDSYDLANNWANNGGFTPNEIGTYKITGEFKVNNFVITSEAFFIVK